MIYIAHFLALIAAVCFIFGLKMMGKTDQARKGNAISAIGMLAAIVGAFILLINEKGSGFDSGNATAITIALVIGGIVGAVVALRVQMTSMPEMVALFNGFGGIASLLIAAGEYSVSGNNSLADDIANKHLDGFTAATMFIAALIGGLTFTGSLIAFGKLSEKISSAPIMLPMQNLINGGLLAAMLAGVICFAAWPDQGWIFWIAVIVSFVLGVMAVLPIGGADMPVVISLLNSYSGLAACAAGFATNNVLLITIGALVGASGIILTRIMCKAMNRSLANVLFSGFGSTSSNNGGAGGPQGEAKILSAQDAYYMLEAASSVVVIPGYGMAVAQAQHAVRELGEILEENGCDVKYAIHPVAGRMPGHMNVLLAEANVSYDVLVEMDDINPQIESVDIAIVIGANDTVNPSALDDENSSIYGMPIIEAHRARQVFVLKRSMRPGFAGVENPLFFKENTSMILGDAKSTVEALVGEFKES